MGEVWLSCVLLHSGVKSGTESAIVRCISKGRLQEHQLTVEST